MEAKSEKKADKRTKTESDNRESVQPNGGPTESQPIHQTEPHSPPRNPSDTPFLLPDGMWRISRVTCADGSTETLDSIWTYSQINQMATFIKKSTGGCQQHQEAVVLLSDKKAIFTPGKNSCVGVCSTECKALLVSGTDLVSTVEPASGGASLKSGFPLIPDFCPGKLPSSIFMSPYHAENCSEKWTSAFGSGSIQVLEGELRWNVPAIRKLEAHSISSLGTLSGDFNIEVHYNGLEAVGRGAYFKASIVDVNDPKFQAFVLAGNASSLRNESGFHMAAVVIDGNHMDPPNSSTESRTQTSGILRIKKRGTTVTASSTSEGDKSAEKSNPEGKSFSDGTYHLVLSLGSNSNLVDINDVTSVNVKLVSATDSANKTLSIQDDFSCLSVGQN